MYWGVFSLAEIWAIVNLYAEPHLFVLENYPITQDLLSSGTEMLINLS